MGKFLFYAIIAWLSYTIYKFFKNIKVLKNDGDQNSSGQKNKNDILDAEFTDIKEEE
ncbi:MAG: hypothetical protein HQ509_06570 [Candidatus Marinimicrobia bacterium]|nr:hypothetical protein [Candidatus Neomarinimicrobiota bacterium]